MILRFIGEEKTYTIENGIKNFANNKVCIYQSDIPEKTTGFEILSDNGETVSYSEFTVVYSKTEDYIIFTSDTRTHFVFYIYDDDGYIISYLTTTNEISKPNTIFVRSGVGSNFEIVPLEEIIDENGFPLYKIENETVVPITQEDYFFLKEKKLLEAKAEKIEQISAICSQNIVNGIEFNGEHFRYELSDQNNIYHSIQLALMTELPVPYHADGKDCRLFTKEELTAIYIAQENNLIHNITYHNQLKQYVSSLDTVEDVLSVSYGQELTGIYLETYNSIMEHTQTVVTTFSNQQVL